MRSSIGNLEQPSPAIVRKLTQIPHPGFSLGELPDFSQIVRTATVHGPSIAKGLRIIRKPQIRGNVVHLHLRRRVCSYIFERQCISFWVILCIHYVIASDAVIGAAFQLQMPVQPHRVVHSTLIVGSVCSTQHLRTQRTLPHRMTNGLTGSC